MGVTVPRVTFNVDYKDGSAFGDLNLCSVGYGLHQAWIYATMFGAVSIFGTENFVTGLGGVQISLPYIVSILVYAACLLLYGFTNQKFLHIYTDKKTLIFASVSTLVGTVLLFGLPAIGHSWVLDVLSGILTGVGSSLFIVFWGTAFARCDSATIVLNTSIAIAISIFLYAVLFHSFPSPYNGILVAAIPLLEALILWTKTPESFAKRGVVPIFQPLPINKGKFAVRFGAPVLIFGIALGELRQTSLQTIVPAADIQQQMLMLVAAGLSVVIILITILALGAYNKWTRYFRPLIPFIIVVAFFVPLSGLADQSLANTLLVVGFLCFEALMWIFFCELSQRFRVSPVYVCGIGRGLLAGGMLLGSFIPVIAAQWVESIPLGEQSVIVAMLVVMVIAYTLLPREREIEGLIAPCPLVHAVSLSMDNQTASLQSAIASSTLAKSLLNDNATARTNAASAQAAKAVEASTDAPVASDGTPATDMSPEADATAKGQIATEGTAAESSAGDTSAEQNVGEADVHVPSEAQAAMLGITPDAPAPEEGVKRGGGRFRGKCETVANTFLLSSRETEVLFLLAKGHNAAYIQEQLYISEGTAKTHIRHIYRKLDVHNQQELMRIVEEAEPTL